MTVGDAIFLCFVICVCGVFGYMYAGPIAEFLGLKEAEDAEGCECGCSCCGPGGERWVEQPR